MTLAHLNSHGQQQFQVTAHHILKYLLASNFTLFFHHPDHLCALQPSTHPDWEIDTIMDGLRVRFGISSSCILFLIILLRGNLTTVRYLKHGVAFVFLVSI